MNVSYELVSVNSEPNYCEHDKIFQEYICHVNKIFLPHGQIFFPNIQNVQSTWEAYFIYIDGMFQS
jgi:hypothetical protein